MRLIRTVLGGPAVACALCLTVVAPVAVAATTVPIGRQLGSSDGLVRAWDPDESGGGPYRADPYLDRIIGDLDDGPAILVVTPGTDDDSLYPRVGGMVGDHDAVVIDYPEAFGPMIGGRGHSLPFTAPGYDQSRDIAVRQNLAVMARITELGLDDPLTGGPKIVYTGFSQGAEALGDAAVRGGDHIRRQNAAVVLASDPRGPWGAKAFAAQHPELAPVLDAVGLANTGARDPAVTGDLPMVSVVVTGDPVANWQWDSDRPVDSALVNAAGFITVHAARGSDDYGDLARLEHRDTFHSVDGNTEYQVYDARHPLAQIGDTVADGLGIAVGQDELDRWDDAADEFYPLSVPGEDNAAVPVTAVDAAEPGTADTPED